MLFFRVTILPKKSLYEKGRSLKLLIDFWLIKNILSLSFSELFNNFWKLFRVCLIWFCWSGSAFTYRVIFSSGHFFRFVEGQRWLENRSNFVFEQFCLKTLSFPIMKNLKLFSKNKKKWVSKNSGLFGVKIGSKWVQNGFF